MVYSSLKNKTDLETLKSDLYTVHSFTGTQEQRLYWLDLPVHVGDFDIAPFSVQRTTTLFIWVFIISTLFQLLQT